MPSVPEAIEGPVARRRRAVAVASLFLLVGALTGLAVGATVAGSDARVSETVSPTPSPITAATYLRNHPATPRQPFTELLEPFAFSDPAPPLEATAIDGYYLRIVRLWEVGGSHWGLPFHCRRCPAFRVDPGVETLLLYRGRFWLEHQMSGFRAFGHYRVAGDRVVFFNDPNCSRIRGDYRWRRSGTTLSFRVVDDICPFEDERADDLMFSAWTYVRPCLSGIEYWWPALIDCTGGESGVRFG
jgi:hypothetical protein